MLFKIVEGENANIVDIIRQVNYIKSNIIIYPLQYKFRLNGVEFEGMGYFTELANLDELMNLVDLLCRDYTVTIETVTNQYKQVVHCELAVREYLDAPVITLSR